MSHAVSNMTPLTFIAFVLETLWLWVNTQFLKIMYLVLQQVGHGIIITSPCKYQSSHSIINEMACGAINTGVMFQL